MNETKVSVPPHKAPMPASQAPVKTGSAIKGFGSGSMHGSLEGSDTVTKGSNGKSSVRGFSGSSVKGSKV